MTRTAPQGRLRRFWFQLSQGGGIGVTAGSEVEALELAEGARVRFYPAASIVEVVLDVEVSALDQDHVLPNAGPVVVRGVWYPRLNV